MHRLQEFVQLQCLGHSSRGVTWLLKTGHNPQPEYHYLLSLADLLEGPPDDLPELETFKASLEEITPPALPE